MNISEKFNILFLCYGNICRSPMAEALLKNMLPEGLRRNIIVNSAGTHALDGNRAEPFTISAMLTYNMDISFHKAQKLGQQIAANSNHIFAMDTDQLYFVRQNYRDTVSGISLLSDWHPDKKLNGIFDPYGMPENAYLDCAELIRECLTGLTSRINELIKQK